MGLPSYAEKPVVGQSTDAMDTANSLIREFESLRSLRVNWESYWDDIARRVLPHQNVFMRAVLGVYQAERRTEYLFDSTPVQALENCAALFESMLFPRNSRWHSLTPVDPALKENRNIRVYCEDVTDALFSARYSTRANFASQAHENTMGWTAFGTGSLYTDEDIGHNLRYRAINLQDLYIAENHVGLIDRVFRKFDFTATQAAEEWGKEALPPGVQACVDNPTQMHRKFEWLHVCKPRKAPDQSRKDYRGMKFASYYVCITERKLVAEGGYREMPYATSRFMVGPREVYGRSPAFASLADIKMLNEMSRTDINASQLAANPPVLLPEAGQSFALRPAALNYGMVTDDGKPLAYPFVSGAKVDISEEKMDVRRKSIRAAFYGNLFEMLMEHPDMTATQTLQMVQERIMMLTPGLGRQQGEFLGPMIQRELDILGNSGKLPPMPPELQQAGGLIKVEYTNDLSRLQKSQDAIGIVTTLQQLEPLAQVHPEVYDIFDMEELPRTLYETNGGPSKVLLSAEKMAALKDQKAKQAQAAQVTAAAPALAGAAKDAADAHATFTNTMQQGQQPPAGGPAQ